LYALT